MNIYTWQNALWQHLMAQPERMHHALLLHGKSGIGKLDFAVELSKTLLCSQPKNGHACDVCPKCIWFNEGGHPDFKWITTEENDPSEDTAKKKATKKTQISVEQIRTLIQELSLSNHDSGLLRVVLIQPAEALNQASANALLKILEEPPNNTVFILVADNLQRLLPTIISRCQKIGMPVPSQDEALDWLIEKHIQQPKPLLSYVGGSPLLALKNHEELTDKNQVINMLAEGAKLDAYQCVSLMLQDGVEQAIIMLQKWVHDLLLTRFSLTQHYHLQHGSALQLLAKSVNLAQLMGFQKTLLMARQTAQHPLSSELQIENLLLHYKKIFTQ
jgi:DNA polymerase III subunit delta'